MPAPYLYLLTPGDPIRLGLNFDLAGTLHFSPGLSTTVNISQPLINAPNDPEPSESTLPPVRSDTPLYYAGYTPKLAQATVDYLFKLNENWYARGTRRLHRADVRRRRRRDPVEAGQPELGRSAPT